MNIPVDASATTYIQLPVVTITIKHAGVNATDTITLKNNLTNEIVSVQGTFAVNDVIVFDSKQETVTQNGTAIDAYGVFPTLLPVTNNDLEIDTTFSYETLSVSGDFLERYL